MMKYQMASEKKLGKLLVVSKNPEISRYLSSGSYEVVRANNDVDIIKELRLPGWRAHLTVTDDDYGDSDNDNDDDDDDEDGE